MRGGGAHRIEGEVVEHDHLGTGCECFVELAHVLHFNFDTQAGMGGAQRADGGCDRTGSSNVVFLDQDGIEQTHAMVHTTADTHCVFLCTAEPRHGLARVEDAGAGCAQGSDIATGKRGSTRQGLQKIKCAAFASDDGARRTMQATHHIVRLEIGAFGVVPVHSDRCINVPEHAVEPWRTGQHRRLSTQHACTAYTLCRNQAGGDIAAANIFLEGIAHGGVDIGGKFESEWCAGHDENYPMAADRVTAMRLGAVRRMRDQR